MQRRTILQAAGAAALAPLGLRAEPQSKDPLDLNGIKFDREVRVAGVPLLLNGAGVRRKYVFNVYAAGLYLPARTSSVEVVMNMNKPHRVHVISMRDVDANELGRLFVKGMQANATRDEFAKSIPGTIRIGELFAAKKSLKTEESFSLDWIPGAGTQILLNLKPLGEPVREVEFFTSLLKIWIGDKPADANLKAMLLGQPVAA